MGLLIGEGECEGCGYPRRGLGSGPCPECGWDIRVGGSWSWRRTPRFVRTLWIAGCPFACHGVSLYAEQFAERWVATGLAASMLVIASLLLITPDAAAAWRTVHGEPLGLKLRVWSAITQIYAIAAVVVCGLMLVAPA